MMMLRIVAGILNHPLWLAFIIAGVGLLLLRGSRRRLGAWVIAAGATLAYLGSTSLVGNALLAPLEHRYPAFEPAQATAVHDIVVLGSAYEPYDHIPVTGALDADGLTRIVEGVRLARARPEARLLVSGGAPPGFAPSALGYAEIATELGIQRSALVVMDRALDTDQEAQDIAALLGQSPFILVTSAYHMPRAMQLMRRAGANPLPAPTGQFLHSPQSHDGFGLIPGSLGLRKTETALHEYLGIAAVNLRIPSRRVR
jgi:uncharacterized SAM-binding protein YcdF (DUF218 family)